MSKTKIRKSAECQIAVMAEFKRTIRSGVSGSSAVMQCIQKAPAPQPKQEEVRISWNGLIRQNRKI